MRDSTWREASSVPRPHKAGHKRANATTDCGKSRRGACRFSRDEAARTVSKLTIRTTVEPQSCSAPSTQPAVAAGAVQTDETQVWHVPQSESPLHGPPVHSFVAVLQVSPALQVAAEVQ